MSTCPGGLDACLRPDACSRTPAHALLPRACPGMNPRLARGCVNACIPRSPALPLQVTDSSGGHPGAKPIHCDGEGCDHKEETWQKVGWGQGEGGAAAEGTGACRGRAPGQPACLQVGRGCDKQCAVSQAHHLGSTAAGKRFPTRNTHQPPGKLLYVCRRTSATRSARRQRRRARATTSATAATAATGRRCEGALCACNATAGHAYNAAC